MTKRNFYWKRSLIPLIVVYDDEADVIYIDFYNPPRSSNDTELTDDDVIIRYGELEEIVGLTILNANTR